MIVKTDNDNAAPGKTQENKIRQSSSFILNFHNVYGVLFKTNKGNYIRSIDLLN